MIAATRSGAPARVRLVYASLSVAAVVTLGATLGTGERVLQRVEAPGGGRVAVCRADAGFDGGYTITLERPGTGEARTLYSIGDGDPCSELVWSADGQILAVLSEHVARTRFVDVNWAVTHPDVRTAYWSWRVVDLSTEGQRVRGAGLRFVGSRRVEIQTCSVDPTGACVGASVRRFDVPTPVVTGHHVNPG